MSRQDEFSVQAAIVFRLKDQHVPFQHPTVRTHRYVPFIVTEWICDRQYTLRHLVSSNDGTDSGWTLSPTISTVVVETPHMASKVRTAISHRGDILLSDGRAVGAHKRRG